MAQNLDEELAFWLQLDEALAASAVVTEIPSSSSSISNNEASPGQASNSSRGGRRGDGATARAEQSRELSRWNSELVELEKAQKERQSFVVEMLQISHDKEFANSISQIPDEEWEAIGALVEKPFETVAGAAGEDEGAWDENEDSGEWKATAPTLLSTDKDICEECPICTESTPVAGMFIVRSCSHKVCLDCLSRHVEVNIKERQVPVRCPVDCSNCLELDQCEVFLPAEMLELYTKYSIEAKIPESDRVYCPYPNCSALMSKDGQNTSDLGSSSTHPHPSSIGCCECMECHRLFCVECQVPWHADLSCAAYQKLPPDARGSEDIKLYLLANNKKWQQCKKCLSMIELNQGCYHMTCRCGHEFCYACGADFKNKHATCKCMG